MRNHTPLLVDERDVLAVEAVEVVVGETVCVVLADVNHYREVRERLRSRVARHRERQITLKVVRHPVGVSAVREKVRLRRTDRLPRYTAGRERTGTRILGAFVPERTERVVVRRARRQVRDDSLKSVVQQSACWQCLSVRYRH